MRGATDDAEKFFCKAQKRRQTCVMRKGEQCVKKKESYVYTSGGQKCNVGN